MPSTYAHTRFGAKVLTLLPQDAQCTVEKHRALYDIGLQGPDVLFHYKALSKNPVNELGRGMHKWSGKKFFGALVDKAQDDAAKAYLFGLLCHFTLDSVCHSTINAIAARTDVHHFDVETELERTLMLADGLDPVKFSPTAHFAPNDDLARVMADFFGIERKEAIASAKGMKRNIALLVPRNVLWRNVVGGLLKSVHADTFFRLMIPKAPKAGLAQEMPGLRALEKKAEETAVRLIGGFYAGDMLCDEQMQLDFATGTKAEE